MGVSGRLGPIHLGASVYQDDLFLDLEGHIDPVSGIPYTFFFGKETYTERFIVQAYSIGTKFKNLSLDVGVIRTDYDLHEKKSQVHLYSGSFFYGKFLFNFAIRNEITPSYKVINGKLLAQQSQNEIFSGLQRSFGKYIILGINYNFYLLREISLNGTLFF